MTWSTSPRTRCRHGGGRLMAIFILMGMLALPGMNAAPALAAEAGSWAVTLPRGPLLTTPGRSESTAELRSPAPRNVAGGRITRVSWRYEVSDDRHAVRAWLCHPRRCVALASGRGGTRRFEGLPADMPFVLRFRRDETASSSIRIGRVQLIVNYR
ncbi:hypothetical protein Csal_2012 [Chromohalobacter israelensis DSM 3043]|uniref:Flagellar protein FlhE n=2 Tax=Chromohalobacter israelensis TaxID=141390 RepID=Q1QVZ5_CHRI1|nr:hypothetical protein Csal_2012 [Chromohalobacter salexigens DSM 3043]